MHRVPIAVCVCALALLLLVGAGGTQTQRQDNTQVAFASNEARECSKKCEHKQWHKRQRAKLRDGTSRNPIPGYIVACESGGNYRALNLSGSGAAGRYQILPSTWAVSLPSARWVHIAGGNYGPRWSSKLLQDKVAAIIWARDGSGAWSCA